MYPTQSLQRSARLHPGKLAATCGDHRTGYATLLERVARLGGALRACGVRPGDR